MTANVARRVVRAWVAVYTRGLPASLRADRIDEIQGDLWSHREDAALSGGSDSALGVAILTRWLFGIGGDVAWRLERGRIADRTITRSTHMGTRIIALLAILGGLGLALAVANWAVVDLGNPGGHDWEKSGWTETAIVGAAGVVALGLALGGLGFILMNRYDSGAGLVVELGVLSVLGLVGAYAAIILLPIASVAAVLSLARMRAVGWPLAAIHAVSASGLILGLAAYSDSGLIGISAALMLAYCLTWIVFGLELLRGLPAGHAAPQSAS